MENCNYVHNFLICLRIALDYNNCNKLGKDLAQNVKFQWDKAK